MKEGLERKGVLPWGSRLWVLSHFHMGVPTPPLLHPYLPVSKDLPGYCLCVVGRAGGLALVTPTHTQRVRDPGAGEASSSGPSASQTFLGPCL